MLFRDNIKLGLIIGFLAPFLGLINYYLMRFRLYTVKEFYQVLMMQKSLLSSIIAIALVMNVLLFTLYINKQKDKTATGIFIASCVYGLISLGIKWFA
jgi:uncharacterized membrane protein